MTVCLGLICNGGNTIVVAADKKITASNPPIEFEHIIPKIEKLSPKCVALTSGNALAHTELFRAVRNDISSITNPTLQHIASKIREHYVSLRIQNAEELHLKPKGLTIESLYKNMQVFHPEFVMALSNKLQNEGYNLWILLAGIDVNGAHIYQIFDPGLSACFDTIGFNAIGSGEIHAISSLIANKCSPLTPVNEAIYYVYEAKKIAEVAPGVGKMTDLIIVNNDGINKLDDKQLDGLREIFDEKYQTTLNINEMTEALFTGQSTKPAGENLEAE